MSTKTFPREAFNKVFTTNDNGVRIVKCCASCEHCSSDGREVIRICMAGHGERPNTYLCKDWEIQQTLRKDAKYSLKTMQLKADGRVIRPEYVAFVKQQIEELSHQNLDPYDIKLMAAHFPEIFERTHGSRFLCKGNR